MRRVWIHPAVFLAAVVALCTAWLLLYSRDAAARIAGQFMDSEVARGNFSGAVLVSRGNRVLFEHAYGFADSELGIPNTPQTRFLIGSITKSFTAVMVMQLEQEKRLSLSDPVCRYLDACPTEWRVITLRQLLSHSSGIFNVTDTPGFEALLGTAQTREQMLARMFEHPLAFEPGKKYSYSNSNYYLLGIVVETAGADSYERILRRRILDPLQMHDTGISAREAQASRVNGYRRNAEAEYEVAPDMHESWTFGCGSLYSTVRDLEKFSEALASGALLPHESLERMWRPDVGEYGFGFQTSPPSTWSFGRRMVEHAGRMPGYVSIFQRYVDDDVTVIALSNHVDALPARVARGLGAAAFGVSYESPFDRKPIKVSAATMRRFAGQYLFEGMKFSLELKGDGMVAKVEGGPAYDVFFESDSAFYVDGLEGSVIAQEDGTTITGLWVPVRGTQKRAERLR